MNEPSVDTFEETLAEAKRCYVAGDYMQTEGLCRLLLQSGNGDTAARHLIGLVHLARGDAAAAADQIKRAVAADDGNAEYHNHLGVALAELGQKEQAVVHFERAARIAPDRVDVLYNLANGLRMLSRYREAVPWYEKAAEMAPDRAEIHYNLANTHHDLKELKNAAASYREAVRVKPDYAKAHNNLGSVLRELGEYADAEQAYRQALRIRPDYVEVHHNLGILHHARGAADEAVACFRHALQLKPDFAAARNSLAKRLVEKGDFDEAISLLAESNDRSEACLETRLELAEQLRLAERWDQAVACGRELVEQAPHNAQAHNSLGRSLLSNGESSEAVECFRTAIKLQPDFAEAHNSLAAALHNQGHHTDSLRHVETSLSITPEFSVAHMNRAMTWLFMGDLERGWHEFEWRRRCEQNCGQGAGAPRWMGGDLPHGTVLLYAEQGLGDTFQFVRYAPLAKRRCGNIVVRCQKPLRGLLERTAGIDQLIVTDEEAPPVDAEISLLSLPRLFGTTFDNMPNNVPYILPDTRLVDVWRDRLADHDSKFKVGIAWQGSRQYRGDHCRSVPLRYFECLADVPNVQFFCLQRQDGREQLDDLPDGFPLTDFGPDFDQSAGTFMDTAAVMPLMDLIITSDTSIPHLAGALGRHVWVALNFVPDWRWLQGREDNPWYPTMRVFRQTQLNVWDDVFERISAELAALVDGDSTKLHPAVNHQVAALDIPVSPGELIDKITILEIKNEQIDDTSKLDHVQHELDQLRRRYNAIVPHSAELTRLSAELRDINGQLWCTEDEIRRCESHGDFGDRFVRLARSVYKANDRRAALKRDINTLLGSDVVEEKQYIAY